MRRILCFVLFTALGGKWAQSQCTLDQLVEPVRFSGTAPAPWNIDGSVTDWISVLGQPTGNPFLPFTFPSATAGNYSVEFGDLDMPAADADAKVTAFTYDSKNVYFYFRRTSNAEPPPSYYFFIDLNFDGHMNTGEPVIGGRFAGASPLSMFSYIPSTADLIPGKGNRMMNQDDPVPVQATRTARVDGYTMPGTLQRLFTSNNIPSANSLLPGEQFKQHTTEDGYGVELAVPWRFLRNWQSGGQPLNPGNVFLFRTAIQKGPSSANFQYDPARVSDNMGSCCRRLMFNGLPAVSRTFANSYNAAQRKLTIEATVQNTTNVPEYIQLAGIVFPVINGNPSDPNSFNGDDLQVVINGMPQSYNPGNNVAYDVPGRVTVAPGAAVSYTIEITIPAGSSVNSYQINTSFLSYFEYLGYRCTGLPSLLGGGGGGNPIILDVTTESRNRLITQQEQNPLQDADAFRVFPNPSRGDAMVLLPAGTASQGVIRIEDMSGKLIRTIQTGTNRQVRINGLRPGFYLVRYTSDGKGTSYVSRLVVN